MVTPVSLHLSIIAQQYKIDAGNITLKNRNETSWSSHSLSFRYPLAVQFDDIWSCCLLAGGLRTCVLSCHISMLFGFHQQAHDSKWICIRGSSMQSMEFWLLSATVKFQTTMKLETHPVVFIAIDWTIVLLFIDFSFAKQVMANTRNSGDGQAASRIIAGAGTKQWNRLVNLTMPKSSLGIDSRNDAFRRMHDHWTSTDHFGAPLILLVSFL